MHIWITMISMNIALIYVHLYINNYKWSNIDHDADWVRDQRDLAKANEGLREVRPPVTVIAREWLLKGVRWITYTPQQALNCPPASQLAQGRWLRGACQADQAHSSSPAGNGNRCSSFDDWWNYTFKSSLLSWPDYDCRRRSPRHLGNTTFIHKHFHFCLAKQVLFQGWTTCFFSLTQNRQ